MVIYFKLYNKVVFGFLKTVQSIISGISSFSGSMPKFQPFLDLIQKFIGFHLQNLHSSYNLAFPISKY